MWIFQQIHGLEDPQGDQKIVHVSSSNSHRLNTKSAKQKIW